MRIGRRARTHGWQRSVMVALVVGFTVGAGATLAAAGTATSAFGYSTINGHEYQNYATIVTSTNNARAYTVTKWNSGGTTAGWAGARGRLFTSGGALSCEGTTSYNPYDNWTATGYSCTRTTSGAWYSYGVSYGWTGSSYSPFYTFKSPNQNS